MTTAGISASKDTARTATGFSSSISTTNARSKTAIAQPTLEGGALNAKTTSTCTGGSATRMRRVAWSKRILKNAKCAKMDISLTLTYALPQSPNSIGIPSTWTSGQENPTTVSPFQSKYFLPAKPTSSTLKQPYPKGKPRSTLAVAWKIGKPSKLTMIASLMGGLPLPPPMGSSSASSSRKCKCSMPLI